MRDEVRIIRGLLRQLQVSPLHRFPPNGGRLEAPIDQGVYLIFGPKGRLLHVGRTPRAKRGLAQRLRDHLNGASSFVIQYLNGRGQSLRRGYTYRYLVVRSRRKRAMLEALAIGALCPAHIGLG